MMINLGEAEIFERKMPQPLDGLVGRKTLFLNLLEQLTKIF